MKKQLILAAVLLSVSLFAGKVKFFDLSWHCPGIDFLEEHLEEIENTTPLDGLTIGFFGKYADPKNNNFCHSFRDAWCNCPWSYEEFDDFIARYKKLKFKKCKDNFLYLTTNDAKFNWFNDQDWKCIAHNFAVAARIAKETGMKGFLFDLEEYGIPFWNYDEKANDDIPFAEAEKVAFKRGQEWGNAVFEVYPSIYLMMPFAFLIGEYGKNNLANAFINGIIDVMPPEARIYEGDEGPSYRASNRAEFQALRNDLARFQNERTYPQNRAKAAKQYKLAPGLYLDAFFCLPENNYWVRTLQPEMGQEPNRVRFFVSCLKEAMEVADDYIWFYGEHRCWWPNSKHPDPECNKLWDDEPCAKNLTKEILKIK